MAATFPAAVSAAVPTDVATATTLAADDDAATFNKHNDMGVIYDLTEYCIIYMLLS